MSEQTGWKKFNKWLLILPLAIYIPGILGGIPYPSSSASYTDLLLTHYPNALYLKNTLFGDRLIPLWSNMIFSGAPFAANPLSGLFYFPGWLALIFPLPAGISITLALHSIFGAWGFYRLLEKEGAGDTGAIFGALAFGMMPKIAAHYGAGHVSLLYALAWTPWLLLVSRSDRRGWKTGIVFSCLFIADPRWAVYAGLLWISYKVAHRQNGLKDMLLSSLKTGILAILLTAPLILPLLEYTRLSTRSLLSAGDVLLYSLPLEKFLGLIIPGAGGNPEWYLYFGGWILLVTIIQFYVKDLMVTNRFWLGWAIISLTIALGTNIPGAEWLASLPLISLLRVPARALFLTGIAFGYIFGQSINWWEHNDLNKKTLRRITFGLITFSIILTGAFYFLTNSMGIRLIWGLAFQLIFVIGLLVFDKSKDLKFGKYLLAIVIIVDLMGAGFLSFVIRPKNEVFDVNKSLIAELKETGETFRTFSPSYSLPQYISVKNGIEITDGVDPLQIRTYTNYMATAAGIPLDGYSVTIPPFKTGNPREDNRGSVPDPFLLGLLNVNHLISSFEIKAEGFVYEGTVDGNFVYSNDMYLPRAWVEVQKLRDGDPGIYNSISEAEIIEIKPNQIHLTALGPGTLILSEINYPGWIATVDGERTKITPAYEILRSVKLLEGEHEVLFDFRPTSLYVGVALAFAGWIYVLWEKLREDQ